MNDGTPKSAGLDLDLLRRYRDLVLQDRAQGIRVRVLDADGNLIPDGFTVEVRLADDEDPLDADKTVGGSAYLELGSAFGEGGEVKKRKAELEQEVGDHMMLDADEPIDRWTAGGWTTSCSAYEFAQVKDREAAVNAMRRTDWQIVRDLAQAVIDNRAAAAGLNEDPEALADDESRFFGFVCRALAGDGDGELLSFGYNANSLSSRVRELLKEARLKARKEGGVPPEDDEALPEAWRGVIGVGSKWRVGVTAAKRGQ